MTEPAKPPRPASTILLLRDSATTKGEIEVFMMVRHYEIDFNSGALVFPGGSVDKGDQEIIANPSLYSGGEGLDAATLSFRIAAIRETFEESGILLARPKGSKALVDAKRASEIEAAHRADLCDSKISFLKVLSDNGMVLALDELVPTSHWITPEGMPKRFDTWFFLASVARDTAVTLQEQEAVEYRWLTPADALAHHKTGEMPMVFPTIKNLEAIAKATSSATLMDSRRGAVIESVEPRVIVENGRKK